MFQADNTNDVNEVDVQPVEETPQMCNQCQIIPEQYISLKCLHNFCLSCITQIYKEITIKTGNHSPPMICPFDNEETYLDEYSISVLQKIIEETEGNREIQEFNEKICDEREEKQQMYAENNSNQIEEAFIEISEPVHEETYEDRVKPFNGPFQNNDQFAFCSKHMKDICNLYCVFCNEGLFCKKCRQGTAHDQHEVINLEKHPDFLKIETEKLNFQLISMKNDLIETVGEFESKIKVIHNKVSDAKNQISNDFKDLREKLMAKEKELLAKMEKYSIENTQVIEQDFLISQEKLNHLIKIEEKTKVLKGNDDLRLDKLVKIYSQFKKEMDKIDLKPIEMQQKETEDFKCHLNMDSFYKYLENIHILKLEIAGFSYYSKGLNTNNSNNNENNTNNNNSNNHIHNKYYPPNKPPITNFTKSYLNPLNDQNKINNNTNNINISLDYYPPNGHHNNNYNNYYELESQEMKRKTMYENMMRFQPEGYSQVQNEKKPYIFLKPTYMNGINSLNYASNNNSNDVRRSLAMLTRSSASFIYSDKFKENQRNLSFLRKMGVSKIEEKEKKGKVEKLMSSLEKQKSLFERNKVIF